MRCRHVPATELQDRDAATAAISAQLHTINPDRISAVGLNKPGL
jgi:hypothetical protein